MKLASLRNGHPDGQLVVVSRDLTRYAEAGDIAPNLQTALDNWADAEPKLQALSDAVNDGSANTEAFDPAKALSPLPRSYQWADGSAYVNHVELVRKARGAEMPETFWTDPLMYQGGSDAFLAPQEDIPLADDSWGCDFEGEVAVITGNGPIGIGADAAAEQIRLLMIVNDVSLRGLIPGELAKGFGFFQSKPQTAFSPVAVTPDELGAAWDGRKLSLPLVSHLNGDKFGEPDCGTDMTFDFGELVAHLAKTRPLTAGTIVGSGTISNKLDDGPGKPVSEGGKGYSCIAEIRMIETIYDGAPKTPFMTPGDTIRIEMFDKNGDSIFGAIDQKVVRHSA
ncbi:fumarylacetoacetate hydrolase family protein [Hyphobacterium sp.]|uniref:fumarylacetoacetate hydrolase family protein n=1 Tax=Hyphobacterium sp. TaxID=2004662 RepID=UPI003BA8B837